MGGSTTNTVDPGAGSSYRADLGRLDLGVTITEAVEHHGIKGMKWGSRKSKTVGKVSETNVGGKKSKVLLKITDKGKVVSGKGGAHSPSSHDAANATAYAQIAKTSGTHALSNHELQHLVNRMNLEQSYSRLASSKSSPAAKGAKFAANLLANIGKQQATMIIGGMVARKVATVIK